ncbi:MAG: hypothetical protein A3A29_00930 [Candidatus Ryanbacteria bacterium RIFCSPLOWO2_01_FULL_47_79]|nr:MAG: hypothetical protein A3A29_00930 [Candidatus Ryanbacteria bacterium RIFCSPLOWO2_01_FULL_47_79]
MMKLRRSSKFVSGGISMFELVIVLAIGAILMGFVVRGYYSFFHQNRLNEAVENIVNMLQKARNRTLSSYDETGTGASHCVHFDPAPTNKVSLFQFNSSDSTCSIQVDSLNYYELSSPVEIVSVTGLGALQSVVFQRISGDATTNGVLDLAASASIVVRSSWDNSQRTITISPTGVIQVE